MKAKILLPILALICVIASPLLSQTADTINLDNDGYIDGIYKCTADHDGKTDQVTIALNGRGDGSQVMMIAADKRESGDFYGVGTGTVSGAGNTSFSGTTYAGTTFSFSVQYGNQIQAGFYDNITLTGTHGLPSGSTAQMTCDQAY